MIEKKKISNEIKDNQKNPEIIATTKGQNIQNLENTKKRSEELSNELKKQRKNSILLRRIFKRSKKNLQS